jgi:hypothetical protein
MMNRLEDLWQSADDGASSPIGPLDVRRGAEFDDLLDAWYIERRNSVECEILLEQAKELIATLASEAEQSPSSSRKARRLVRAIDRTLQMVNSGRE